MKAIAAGLLTLAIVAAMLAVGSRYAAIPRTAEVSEDSTGAANVAHPAEVAVRQLLKAADTGNVPRYIASFSGEMRSRLDRSIAERGADAFSEDLRRSASARKGHAIFAAEADGEASARVVVESVYPDRNERQTYRIDRTPEGWRIVDVATVRTNQPSAKFGSAAHYVAPEGVPVQAGAGQGGLTVETGEEPASP